MLSNDVIKNDVFNHLSNHQINKIISKIRKVIGRSETIRDCSCQFYKFLDVMWRC